MAASGKKVDETLKLQGALLPVKVFGSSPDTPSSIPAHTPAPEPLSQAWTWSSFLSLDSLHPHSGKAEFTSLPLAVPILGTRALSLVQGP